MQTFIRPMLQILSLLASGSFGAASAADGTIHFHGQVVESPCEYQSGQRQVNVTCYHNGRSEVETVPLNAMLQGKADANNQGMATMHWIDKNKKTAILTVAYK